MPLEYTVESLDTVEDGLRGAYVESEGKYQLDPDKYHEIKAAGLKKKINEKIELEKKLKTELSRFEKFKDIDTDLLERLILVSQVTQFGRADEGEVSRVENDDRPFALQVGVGYRTKLAVVKSSGFERFDFSVDQ